MAWTQAQLDAIDAAIAQGTRVVEYEGKRVEYLSLTEMITVRRLIRVELGLDKSGESTRIKTDFSKGLGS